MDSLVMKHLKGKDGRESVEIVGRFYTLSYQQGRHKQFIRLLKQDIKVHESELTYTQRTYLRQCMYLLGV